MINTDLLRHFSNWLIVLAAITLTMLVVHLITYDVFVPPQQQGQS